MPRKIFTSKRPLKHFFSICRDHPYSTYAKFSKILTFFTSRYAHLHVLIKEAFMSFFVNQFHATCLFLYPLKT